MFSHFKFTTLIAAATVCATVTVASAVVTPGAVLEYNASNNPGAGSNQFTNLGSAGGFLTPESDVQTGFGGFTPELLNEGPGGSLTKSYGHTDGSSNITAWTGTTAFTIANGGVSVEMWIRRDTLDTVTYNAALTIPGNANEMLLAGIHKDGAFNRGIDFTPIAPTNSGIGASAGSELGLVRTNDALAVSDDNAWHHIVYTYGDSGSFGTMRIYLDGVEVFGTQEDLGGSVVMNGLDFNQIALFINRTGTGGGSSNNVFTGDIALYRLYDFALTDTQVLDNYNAVGIPEPASLALLGLGGLTLLARRR